MPDGSNCQRIANNCLRHWDFSKPMQCMTAVVARVWTSPEVMRVV
jgi:hypothetical protein